MLEFKSGFSIAVTCRYVKPCPSSDGMLLVLADMAGRLGVSCLGLSLVLIVMYGMIVAVVGFYFA
jgi:hypothetical protein